MTERPRWRAKRNKTEKESFGKAGAWNVGHMVR